MPRRADIRRILVIGSGPIVIGQACEFDYSGTQAVRALKAEGYGVVLVNSNPATIMTDPGLADRTYVEPITRDTLEKVVARERPDALLPTLGGQTALNAAMELAESGFLDAHGVRMIGADRGAIARAEDRELFKETMLKAGLEVPRSRTVSTVPEAMAAGEELGFPLVLRPAYTLGGSGGGIAKDAESLQEKARHAISLSPIRQVLLEESVLGWKEFELEVMRDRKDNCVIVCSIENLDPMGVHTGDSITVAPAQTLTDREYQRMRDASLAVIRAIGVETGGSNIQFAVNPADGRMVVIEMNPRVSRSSALASKATGFPIAKIAALLAVGYTLDELPNDITKSTPASFEPTIDYVVVKIPRFAFEKFPGARTDLDTSMRSVGETMAIGRTFREALQKGLRSLETGLLGFDRKGEETATGNIEEALGRPSPTRLFHVKRAIREGWPDTRIAGLTGIDPWFVRQLRGICELEERAAGKGPALARDPGLLSELKRDGFSDRQLSALSRAPEKTLRRAREKAGIRPGYRLVDTCAAEFAARTPYYYSTYDCAGPGENRRSDKPRVMILGGGPNRIGQGIEFDYCCVQAAFAARELGFAVVMVNSNPETVSTDYDISDSLYFEPLVLEDVLAVHAVERPMGAIVQLGGQTPLNLAAGLMRAGVRILGTSPADIARAEDRRLFRAVLDRLHLRQAASGTATSVAAAMKVARKLGFPVLVRPSFVLGGRAMEVVYSEAELEKYAAEAIKASDEHPVLIDRFLEDAVEVDVDAVCDGRDFVLGGIMEHIERAGVHSGDSACVLPPHSLPRRIVEELGRQTRLLAMALKVRGLINIQFAVKGNDVYVLEVNPRASRTVPFVGKATGVPLAGIAAKVMMGRSLKELGFTRQVMPRHFSVKEAVFPFHRFPGAEYALGPEMRSTGEVMGVDSSFGRAYAKSQLAAGQDLPVSGGVFLSLRDDDKSHALKAARELRRMGFRLHATAGTAAALGRTGIWAEKVAKLSEGGHPNILDLVGSRKVSLIVNTSGGRLPRRDEAVMRTMALEHGVPLVTTVAGLQATVEGIGALRRGGLEVRSLQEYHRKPGEHKRPPVGRRKERNA